MTDVSLRPASLDDAVYLLLLRNDKLTRANSRSTGEISRDQHLRWLTQTLVDPRRRLYIAVANHETCVGTGRLDRGDVDVELSLTVDPLHRGRGYARQIVRALTLEAGGTLPKTAEIATSNIPSILAFLHEGFTPDKVVDEDERRWLWVRRES